MDIKIQVALLAAVVTVVGWIINHILSAHRERRNQRLAATVRHIERQLEELYGPLSFLMFEGQRVFKDLLEVLGRESVFKRNEPLSESELKTWQFWVENYFIPRNEKIKNLLMSKTHLIVGETLPDSYLTFLDHHNSWMINHLRWQKEKVEYSWHSKINWPFEFEDDVINTFKQLKALHSKLLVQLTNDVAKSDVYRIVQEFPLDEKRDA